MYLIVGLGNPGKEYEKTRHNVGFLGIDILIQEKRLPSLTIKKEFEGAFVKTELNEIPTILLKPHTYMNLSGQAVWKVSHYFKIDPQHLIIIHDDIDLPIGKIRIVQNSSSGGQKGVQSIIDTIGKNFIRVKIGIGGGKKQDTVEHVLSSFPKQEWIIIKETLAMIPFIIENILLKGVEETQNIFN